MSNQEIERLFPSAQVLPIIADQSQTIFLSRLLDISDKLKSDKIFIDISCIHTPEMFVLLKYFQASNSKEKIDIAYSTPFEYNFPE